MATMFAASLNTLKKRATELVKGEDGKGRVLEEDPLSEELGPPSLEAQQALRGFAQSSVRGRQQQTGLEEGPVLVRYEVQNGDVADREGAAFPLPPAPASGITVAHVRTHFPVPGRYHFRFKAAMPDGFFGDFIMVDLNDADPVPLFRNEICIKALRIPVEADPKKVIEPLPGGGRFLTATAVNGGRTDNSPRRSSSPTSPFQSPPPSSYESASHSPPPVPRVPSGPAVATAQQSGAGIGMSSSGAGIGISGSQLQAAAAAATQRPSPLGSRAGNLGAAPAAVAPVAAKPPGPPADLMEMDDISSLTGGLSASTGGVARTPTATASSIAAAAAAAAAGPPSPPVVFDRQKLVAEREERERKRVADACARQQEALQKEEKLKADKVDKNNELCVIMDQWAKTPDGQAYKDIKVLLSTLHTVTWPGSTWKELPLAELVANENNIKKFYRKAILLVHPDKQSETPPEQQVRADRIFQALNEAFKVADK